MKLSKILAMAWENITQRKLRSSLTTLGVVIGVATIISLAALGEGFRGEIRHRMEQGFELDVLIVFPGSFVAGLREGFSQGDIENIKGIDNVTLVTPLITLPTAELYNERTGDRLGAFTVGAVNFTEMCEILPLRFRLLNGTFPEPDEKHSLILGYKASRVNETVVADVGDNVSLIVEKDGYVIYNETFTVKGVLEKAGTSGITNFDYWAFISIETALEMPLFKNDPDPYQIILVKISDTQYSEDVAKNIENLFPPYSITVFVPSALMRQVNNILGLVQMFLIAIASISLLVAGIGIMNIMTVSVMERTREIGILKAIGAKSRTVLAMFLSEALLIGVIGGVIGIFAGYGISFTLTYSLSRFMQPSHQETIFRQTETQPMEFNPVFPLEWILIAFIFAILVCIIFGLYPARKAAKLDPVEALRYE